MTTRILVVDDDTALREMMRLSLSKEGYDVTTASSWSAAESALEDGDYDLVVTDIYLGDGTGIDLLDVITRCCPDARTIMVTAHGTVETAAHATRSGAFDYLAKPFEIGHLVRRVRAALDSDGSRPQRAADLGPESMIIGNDPSIVEVYKAVARVAPQPIPVLVRGETGTGKELIARALHRFGRTPEGPFVAVNCGAIPSELLESELFGHRKGSFTGAIRDHAGAIESARDGTLFLDEVGELPPSMQVKLLRFLQSGEVQPVGADRSVHVDVRVVAATHRDLRDEIRAGRFREDFYYRLSAYEIDLPPLRERPSDIPRLIEHFRRRDAARFDLDDAPGPDATVLDALIRYPWPGNVRQLENFVQRALVDHGSLSDPKVLDILPPVDADAADTAAPIGPGIGDDLTLDELERLHIEAVLQRVGGNRTHAAKILGIERKSLYRKAERFGIDLDPEDP